jgi:hypothetical protein
MKNNLPKSYSEAESFLSGKESRRVPGIRGTFISRVSKDSIACLYHETQVVTFFKNGDVRLDSGGFFTPTTKRRMNQCLPNSVRIYQKNGYWQVSHSPSISFDLPPMSDRPFKDGMVIRPLPSF